MTDRNLLEALLQEIKAIKAQVNKIDGIEESLQKVHVKLDGITQQVVQNSEQINLIKEQTASNSEQYAPLSERMTDIETDLKILKRAFTS